jgi:hypothetical protein
MERGSTKVKACFVMSRDLREQFEHEDAEQKECDCVAKERQKQKEVETAEHTEHFVAHHASCFKLSFHWPNVILQK